ncbi:hypothetical protein ACQR1I_36695 [Bradyrhizobium sp. HKCCYLS2038]|uniref:hypothetical protein n=1 Tax=Bradyrhizobium sp. HKCCYLS2038 TaxID=3420764 RepID=UPI003EBF156D
MTLRVTFKRSSVEAESEFGSLKELAGYIESESALLSKIFGEDMEIVARGLLGGDGATPAAANDEATGTDSEKRKPGRPKKNQPEPATATAPPPASIPGAAPDTTPGPNGVPAFLDRTGQTAAAPPPPPAPPAPPAPPPAPVVPPSGILAGKVIASLEARAAGSDDNKKALVGWLSAPPFMVVSAGADWEGTIAAIRLMNDERLAGVATALQIA